MTFLNTSHQCTVENSKCLSRTKIPIVLIQIVPYIGRYYDNSTPAEMINVHTPYLYVYIVHFTVLCVSPRSCRSSNRGQSFIDLTARTANEKNGYTSYYFSCIILSGVYTFRYKYPSITTTTKYCPENSDNIITPYKII